jgi:hypothetical protein
MDGGSFIRELCLALEHRWEPELPFLLFTAYFDESDTHGPSPNLIMAAFVASARQWELFGRRLRELQRRDGFTVFHATDFRSLNGEFRGWRADKCGRLINDLAVAIRDNLTEGVTVTLPRTLYESEYRAPPIPKGMHLDTQYGVCFRACLHRLAQAITTDRKRHKIHVVIERGHKNAGDALRIFDEVKAELSKVAGYELLGDVTLSKKTESMPLMVADFQAHASHISETRLKAGLPGYFQMVEPRPPKRNERPSLFWSSHQSFCAV